MPPLASSVWVPVRGPLFAPLDDREPFEVFCDEAVSALWRLSPIACAVVFVFVALHLWRPLGRRTFWLAAGGLGLLFAAATVFDPWANSSQFANTSARLWSAGLWIGGEWFSYPRLFAGWARVAGLSLLLGAIWAAREARPVAPSPDGVG